MELITHIVAALLDSFVAALIVLFVERAVVFVRLTMNHRELRGDWYSTWQTNSAKGEAPWTIERVRITASFDFLRSSLTYKTVEHLNAGNKNQYKWSGYLRLTPYDCLIGTWKNDQGRELSKGAVILKIIVHPDSRKARYLLGFILGANTAGTRNYGAWVLTRQLDALAEAKQELEELGPGLAEINWRWPFVPSTTQP